MTADYAALEARVSELEHQMRHILPAKIDAVSYGVSLVHEDIRAVRETLDKHGEMLNRQGEVLSKQGEMLSKHGEMLEQILDRLPPRA